MLREVFGAEVFGAAAVPLRLHATRANVAGRTESELDNVFGLKTNLLVLRTELSGNPMFRDCFAACARRCSRHRRIRTRDSCVQVRP
jgi:hypothetical protein